MNGYEARCHSEGCGVTEVFQATALALGWDTVEGRLFCPLHKAEAARAALKSREIQEARARFERARHLRNHQRAKETLTAAEYRQWDEFQSDLANFHRNHGKLAPRVLRLLDPKTFIAVTRPHGRIDVEAEAEKLLEAERKANATQEWLIRRSE